VERKKVAWCRVAHWSTEGWVGWVLMPTETLYGSIREIHLISSFTGSMTNVWDWHLICFIFKVYEKSRPNETVSSICRFDTSSLQSEDDEGEYVAFEIKVSRSQPHPLILDNFVQKRKHIVHHLGSIVSPHGNNHENPANSTVIYALSHCGNALGCSSLIFSTWTTAPHLTNTILRYSPVDPHWDSKPFGDVVNETMSLSVHGGMWMYLTY